MDNHFKTLAKEKVNEILEKYDNESKTRTF